jgi:hypothetical protein
MYRIVSDCNGMNILLPFFGNNIQILYFIIILWIGINILNILF